MCVITLSTTVQVYSAGNVVKIDEVYFTDATQTQLYTGNYQEYYDNGALKLEICIKNGLPHGTCIMYFDNNQPKEIRSYKNGELRFMACVQQQGALISKPNTRTTKKRIVADLGWKTARYVMS